MDATVMQHMSVYLDQATPEDDGGCLVQIHPTDAANGLVEIGTTPLVVGRVADADLVLVDDSVSRQHAVFELTPAGVVLRDLDSTNGTYVNDQSVARTRLHAGDRIRFGSHIFKFLSNDDIEAQYHETVYAMMTTDGLTAAYNKQYLEETLTHELARSRRHARPLSVLMLDIDHFKTVNDTYGHLAGDEVLQEFSRRVREQLSDDLLFARYGGEEFALIAGESDRQEALQLAERLRAIVEEQPFAAGEEEIQVTVSIGVAFTDGTNGPTAESLLKAADAKLYEAKNNGRNQVAG